MLYRAAVEIHNNANKKTNYMGTDRTKRVSYNIVSLLRYPRTIFLPNIIIVKCANIFVILVLGLLRPTNSCSQDDVANHLAMAMLFIFSWLS